MRRRLTRKIASAWRPLLRSRERAVGCHAPSAERATARGTRVLAADLLRQASDGAGTPAGPHLLVLSGAAAGDRLPLGTEQTLGRSRRADLRLADPGASRLHARVRVDAGGATVEDLSSKNGLWVNGVALRARTGPLRPGDELRLGDTSLALILPGPAGLASTNAVAPPADTDAHEAALPAALHPAPRRGADVRRAAAALLALSAIALALAGT